MKEPTILVAEDEEIDVILLQRAFKAAGGGGLTFKIVRDGLEALEYLTALLKQDGPVLPVLFLLDINMPRCNGLEVLERLQGMPLHRQIPTIVFSSSNHPSDIERAYRLGAHAYLVKPTSTTRRLEMIKTVHAFWLGLNRVPQTPN